MHGATIKISNLPNKMNHFNDINSFVDLYEHDHVNYFYCNIGGIKLAINLAKSCKLQNLPIVFFALDKESMVKMKGLCDIVDASNIGYDIYPDFLEYNTREFNWICFAKYHIAKPILESGRTLTYLDTDIVATDNFQADILNELNKNEDHLLVQSSHGSSLCAGFFSLSPSFDQNIIDLFLDRGEKVLEQDDSNFHDQDLMRKLTRSSKVKFKLLDKDIYPNGAWYYKHSKRIESICKIIHFNCVKGEANKISKYKKFGHWYIDDK